MEIEKVTPLQTIAQDSTLLASNPVSLHRNALQTCPSIGHILLENRANLAEGTAQLPNLVGPSIESDAAQHLADSRSLLYDIDRSGQHLAQLSLSDHEDDAKQKAELKATSSSLSNLLYILLYEHEDKSAEIVYLPYIRWEYPPTLELLKRYLPRLMKMLVDEPRYPNKNPKILLAVRVLASAADVEKDDLRNDLVYSIVGKDLGGIDCLLQRLKTIVETEDGINSDMVLQTICCSLLCLLARLLYQSPRKTECVERILSTAGDIFPVMVSSKSSDVMVQRVSYLMYLMRPCKNDCLVDPELLLPHLDIFVTMFKHAVKRSKQKESIFSDPNLMISYPCALQQWLGAVLEQNKTACLLKVAWLHNTDFGDAVLEFLEYHSQESTWMETSMRIVEFTLILLRQMMSISNDARPATMLCTIGVVKALLKCLQLPEKDIWTKKHNIQIFLIFSEISITHPLLLTRYTKTVLPVLLEKASNGTDFLFTNPSQSVIALALVLVLKQLLTKSSIQTVLWIKEQMATTPNGALFLKQLASFPEENKPTEINFLLNEFRPGPVSGLVSNSGSAIPRQAVSLGICDPATSCATSTSRNIVLSASSLMADL